jgi:hypothetical protein
MEDVATAGNHGRGNPKNLIMVFVRGLLRVLISLLHCSVGAVDAFAAPNEPDSEHDALDSAMRGGVLNYRTERLDDGTDPYGWYKLD